MPTSKKIFTVQNLTEKLKDAQVLILSDYRGLSMAQLDDLRQAIKKAGGELEIIKNTLLKRAADEAKVKIEDEVLTGPTAALWTWEAEIGPLKALADFAKEAGLPKVKFGRFEGETISLERIKELAQLPGLEELKAKLVGQLQSPLYGLTNSLQGNLRKLVYVLKAKGGETNGRKEK